MFTASQIKSSTHVSSSPKSKSVALPATDTHTRTHTRTTVFCAAPISRLYRNYSAPDLLIPCFSRPHLELLGVQLPPGILPHLEVQEKPKMTRQSCAKMHKFLDRFHIASLLGNEKSRTIQSKRHSHEAGSRFIRFFAREHSDKNVGVLV